MRVLAISAMMLCASSALAQTDQRARDWFVAQKRLHKEARIAVAKRDQDGISDALRENFQQGRRVRDADTFPVERARVDCESYQLAVFRLLKNAADERGTPADLSRADQYGDACWNSILR